MLTLLMKYAQAVAQDSSHCFYHLFVVEFGWRISFHFNHGIAVLKVLKVQALVIPAAFVGTIKEDSEF